MKFWSSYLLARWGRQNIGGGGVGGGGGGGGVEGGAYIVDLVESR